LTRDAAAQGAAAPNTAITLSPRGMNGSISLRVIDFGGTTEVTSGDAKFPVLSKCAAEVPPLEAKDGKPGHVAACWVTK
jgi:hypothetical protein